MPRRKTGRARKYNEYLPVGIYETASGSFGVAIWDSKGDKKWLGVFDNPHQAYYNRLLAIQGHHWEGVEHDPKNMWGFVYCITDRRTGKKYIGKKQYRLWNGPTGGYKCTDPTDPDWFDETLWVKNDWETYKGSCVPLLKVIGDEPWNFEFKVLGLCANKLDLHIAEVMEQVHRNVLEVLDSNGEYLYYNGSIAGMEFRAPFLKADMLAKSEQSAKEMKAYYLRPKLCSKCNKIIPFPGTGGCSCS